jgi:hypothetical protein
MFEDLEARVRRLAEARAKAAARRLAERLAEALPGGVRFAPGEGRIAPSGAALRRRLATGRALRLALWGLIDER